MNAKKVGSAPIVYLLLAVFSLAVFQVPAHAALVSTDKLASSAQLQQQRSQLSETLLREDVKEQLLSMGVDPQSVQDRINSLSGAELSQLQKQVDNLPAGGDALGVIAIVLVILILLDITGLTDIFPGI